MNMKWLNSFVAAGALALGPLADVAQATEIDVGHGLDESNLGGQNSFAPNNILADSFVMPFTATITDWH